MVINWLPVQLALDTSLSLWRSFGWNVPAQVAITGWFGRSVNQFMSKLITTQISIHATPGRVWQVLTAFDTYPAWNPLIRQLSGQVRVGETLSVVLQPLGGRPTTVRPTVVSFVPNTAFTWSGHLLTPALFRGLHSFELTANDDGTTTLTHSELWSGLLVPLLARILAKNTTLGFEQMNEKVKQLAEQPPLYPE